MYVIGGATAKMLSGGGRYSCATSHTLQSLMHDGGMYPGLAAPPMLSMAAAVHCGSVCTDWGRLGPERAHGAAHAPSPEGLHQRRAKRTTITKDGPIRGEMDTRWTFYFGKACLLAHSETRLTGVSPSSGRAASPLLKMLLRRRKWRTLRIILALRRKQKTAPCFNFASDEPVNYEFC